MFATDIISRDARCPRSFFLNSLGIFWRRTTHNIQHSWLGAPIFARTSASVYPGLDRSSWACLTTAHTGTIRKKISTGLRRGILDISSAFRSKIQVSLIFIESIVLHGWLIQTSKAVCWPGVLSISKNITLYSRCGESITSWLLRWFWWSTRIIKVLLHSLGRSLNWPHFAHPFACEIGA